MGNFQRGGQLGCLGPCHPFHLQAALRNPAQPGVAAGEVSWRAAPGLQGQEGPQPSPPGDAALDLSTLFGIGCPEHGAEARFGEPCRWPAPSLGARLQGLLFKQVNSLSPASLPWPSCKPPDPAEPPSNTLLVARWSAAAGAEPPVFPALCSVSHPPAGVYPPNTQQCHGGLDSYIQREGLKLGADTVPPPEAGVLHKLLHRSSPRISPPPWTDSTPACHGLPVLNSCGPPLLQPALGST